MGAYDRGDVAALTGSWRSWPLEGERAELHFACRLVDMDHPVLVVLVSTRFSAVCAFPSRKITPAAAQDDQVEPEAILVDEVVGHQRLDEIAADAPRRETEAIAGKRGSPATRNDRPPADCWPWTGNFGVRAPGGQLAVDGEILIAGDARRNSSRAAQPTYFLNCSGSRFQRPCKVPAARCWRSRRRFRRECWTWSVSSNEPPCAPSPELVCGSRISAGLGVAWAFERHTLRDHE
jgi:hypothetical protein